MKYISTTIFLFLSISVFSQKIVKPSLVKWYTFEQADSLSKITPKPIFVDVYTEWCGWCKHMMKTTFADRGIADYLNANFYPVRFDAETLDTIKYNDKVYVNPKLGRKPKHNLAKELMGGKYSFPTIVYIDKDKKNYPVPGYQRVKEIEPILIYFAESLHKYISFEEFKKYFMLSYSDNYKEELAKNKQSIKIDTTGKVNWLTLEDAENKSKVSGKPICIYFYTERGQSCKIYDKLIFRNKIITSILNENYHPVKFNAASQNVTHLFDTEIKPNGEAKPHQLTQMLLKKNFIFPAFVFLTSERQKLDEIHGLLNLNNIELILNYFSEENYKTKNYADFVKTFKSKY